MLVVVTNFPCRWLLLQTQLLLPLLLQLLQLCKVNVFCTTDWLGTQTIGKHVYVLR